MTIVGRVAFQLARVDRVLAADQVPGGKRFRRVDEEVLRIKAAKVDRAVFERCEIMAQVGVQEFGVVRFINRSARQVTESVVERDVERRVANEAREVRDRLLAWSNQIVVLLGKFRHDRINIK